uniref:Uncharacterized protein n=1 Tax=Anguilla anguilla TaxID=7936 RepID=A0A0E9TUD0_ANGAN
MFISEIQIEFYNDMLRFIMISCIL